jgi:hypothetical protein
LHDLFDSLLCSRLLLLFSFWLLCSQAFIAKAVTLSEVELELTSQTVVFAFFVCRKRGDYCRNFSIFQQAVCSSDERKCLARRLRSEARVKAWEEHAAAD